MEQNIIREVDMDDPIFRNRVLNNDIESVFYQREDHQLVQSHIRSHRNTGQSACRNSRLEFEGRLVLQEVITGFSGDLIIIYWQFGRNRVSESIVDFELDFLRECGAWTMEKVELDGQIVCRV